MRLRWAAWILALSTAFAGTARAEVVVEWNQKAFEVLKAENVGPQMSVRTLAMMHGAMFDAVNAIHPAFSPIHVKLPKPGTIPTTTSGPAAAVAAAHRVLSKLYPTQQTQLDLLLNAQLALLPETPGKTTGITLGQSVADEFLLWRSTDGSTQALTLGYNGGVAPGLWRETASGQALAPGWGSVTPWSLMIQGEFRPAAPPALNSAEYAAAYNEALALGAAASTARTPEQTDTANFWNAGIVETWNGVARQVALGQAQGIAFPVVGVPDTTQLFAVLNIALADADIAAWEATYHYGYWRPVTAIQEGGNDGNEQTAGDPSWQSLYPAAPYPEYVGRQSALAGAASRGLSLFLEGDGLTFSALSASNGAVRTYNSLAAAGEEAGRSRVYAGVHFEFSNQAGLQLGRQVAENVFNTAMMVLPPKGLKSRKVPEPPDLDNYLKGSTSEEKEYAKRVAIALGKALFWDQQVGSDGVACASCHFHAGADNRVKNQLNPGAADAFFGNNQTTGNIEFPGFRPNYTADPDDFPTHLLSDPDDPASPVVRDTNDVWGSQGLAKTKFVAVRPRGLHDQGVPEPDPVFQVHGVNVRQVTGRNAPSVINAVFNAEQFWDGRASRWFNGQNPFGPYDPDAGIWVNTGSELTKQRVLLANSSLASQALGPPLNDVEMSFAGRTWPDIGRKLISRRALAYQIVHPDDSVLGGLSLAKPKSKSQSGVRAKPKATARAKAGLATTYGELIRAAYRSDLWNSAETVTINGNEFTHMEANFSFFFGLSVQLYEATLVSDDSPFDRSREDPPRYTMTASEARGQGLFLNKGHCAACHDGPEFQNASVALRIDGISGGAGATPGGSAEIMELMLMKSGRAFYDGGFYNVALRPLSEFIGRGDTMPFINAATGEQLPLSFVRRGLLKRQSLIANELLPYVPSLPGGGGFPDPNRVAVDGASKVPTLRNVELTGPYLSNGSQGTLMQAVEFYDRGGDFPQENGPHMHPDIRRLKLGEDAERDIVAFLLTLTDERVRQESAPFDHPQLFLSHGVPGNQDAIDTKARSKVGGKIFRGAQEVIELPAVGAGGRPAEGLPPLGTFLGMDPFMMNPPENGTGQAQSAARNAAVQTKERR